MPELTKTGPTAYCIAGRHDLCTRPNCPCTCGHPKPPRARPRARRRTRAPKPLTAMKPPPKHGKGSRPAGRARIAFNTHGQRVCPECRVTVFVKKDPLGRGRYPSKCDSCKRSSR